MLRINQCNSSRLLKKENWQETSFSRKWETWKFYIKNMMTYSIIYRVKLVDNINVTRQCLSSWLDSLLLMAGSTWVDSLSNCQSQLTASIVTKLLYCQLYIDLFRTFSMYSIPKTMNTYLVKQFQNMVRNIRLLILK